MNLNWRFGLVVLWSLRRTCILPPLLVWICTCLWWSQIHRLRFVKGQLVASCQLEFLILLCLNWTIHTRSRKLCESTSITVLYLHLFVEVSWVHSTTNSLFCCMRSWYQTSWLGLNFPPKKITKLTFVSSSSREQIDGFSVVCGVYRNGRNYAIVEKINKLFRFQWEAFIDSI